jgi:hypothetical protein
LNKYDGDDDLLVGVASSRLDPALLPHADGGWYLNALDGRLYGEGCTGDSAEPSTKWHQGDRVGLQFDPAEGTLQFHHNGQCLQAGFEGLALPLVCSVGFSALGQSCKYIFHGTAPGQ